MSNSRLLHMYGFAEEKNEFDDFHVFPDVIKEVIREENVEGVEAKIKLLDGHGFFDEGNLFLLLKKYAAYKPRGAKCWQLMPFSTFKLYFQKHRRNSDKRFFQK